MNRHCQMLLLVLPLAGGAAAESAPVRRYVEAGVGALGHDGYLQTPAGGEPGTASAGRPTLDELGLATGSYRWLAGAAGIGRHALHLRYTAINATGNAALNAALTSQGRTFAPDSALHSHVALDGLSVAFTRSFGFDGRTTLAVGPWVGWTAFHLLIEGAGQRVDRSYHVYALGARLGLNKDLSERWRLGAAATVAPAFSGSAARYTVEPSLSYRARDNVSFRLGARLAAFRYDDGHKQTWPNRLRVDRRVVPAISVRLQL